MEKTCPRIALLKDIATIERRSIQPQHISTGTIYVGLEHITGEGEFINVSPVTNGVLGSSKFIFHEGHILFGKLRPYLKKTARPNFKGICSTDILPILPSKKILKDYLFHFLRLPNTVSKVTTMSSGANLPRISPKLLEQLEVPLPPLDEQKRIAAILDKADAIRRKRQQAMELADEFLRAVFLDMFGDPVTNPKGWKTREIHEVAAIQGGLSLSGKRKDLEFNKPYLRVANVYRNTLNLAEVKEISLTQSEFCRTKLEQGDILIVEGHGNPNEIGRCAVWDASVPDCVHQNHLIRVRFDSSAILPYYASYYINSSSGRLQMLKAGKTTSGLNTISISDVKKTKILVPSMELQLDFQDIVSNVVSKIQNNFDQAARQTDNLFSSLQIKAFQGML